MSIRRSSAVCSRLRRAVLAFHHYDVLVPTEQVRKLDDWQEERMSRVNLAIIAALLVAIGPKRSMKWRFRESF